MSFLFDSAKSLLEDFSTKIGIHEHHDENNQNANQESHEDKHHDHSSGGNNRYQSFAPVRQNNDAKWYVDGCSYMWAVSVAIEEARESIWILDWWLSPEIYLRRPPSKNERYRLDRMLIAAAERGVKVNVIVYKEVSQILTLNSEHTKKTLEVHPNIKVFRHPDHIPHEQAIAYEFEAERLKEKFSFHPIDLIKLPADGLKAVYGATGDTILYWAHHEKLCLVDGRVAFMGGLDLCFGRWDTNSHPIADAHPADLEQIFFPGQDFNNARIFDFADVQKPDENKLDRAMNSRMGWTDVALSLHGSVVQDLRSHFVERWNFIFNEKYAEQRDEKYAALDLPYLESGQGPMDIQLLRSASKWSNGTNTEHSIQNAYIETIRNSQHFVYIENQFFITATDGDSGPVKNRIGEAIVERIVRAHREGQKYKAIVVMPAVPAFAGDLHADDSLGTRAIMEYQYHSISRGGHSIMEAIQRAGIDDGRQYIRFYNLRNYDRINAGAAMQQAENESGVKYENARREHDDIVGAGYGDHGEGTGAYYGRENDQYENYQNSAENVQNRNGQQDTVSACYMENGPSLVDVPFYGDEEAEMNAFVSEELYIHTKLLIADDQIVICGSANLNDRSQLGDHDSEIAVLIQDNNQVDSIMDNQQYRASAYASSLRRQIFRKHLGLLPAQDPTRPDQNFSPIDQAPNAYDWGSNPDRFVADVLSDDFDRLWRDTAKSNTGIFERAFHCIPADHIHTWEQYDDFYGNFFIPKTGEREEKIPAKYMYGHVVKEEFGGGVRELKECLGGVRGNLVEMPMFFMDGVDFAVEGLSFNAFTDVVYT